jgi:hypothetical protein
MRLGGVPGVAHPADWLALVHVIPNSNEHASALQVREHNGYAPARDRHMIAGRPLVIRPRRHLIGQSVGGCDHIAAARGMDEVPVDLVALQIARIQAAGPRAPGVQPRDVEGERLRLVSIVVVHDRIASAMRDVVGAIAQRKRQMDRIRLHDVRPPDEREEEHEHRNHDSLRSEAQPSEPPLDDQQRLRSHVPEGQERGAGEQGQEDVTEVITQPVPPSRMEQIPEKNATQQDFHDPVHATGVSPSPAPQHEVHGQQELKRENGENHAAHLVISVAPLMMMPPRMPAGGVS